MLKLFLSYARADGQPAADDLRARLTRVGYQVWQDTQELRGGAAWRAQVMRVLPTMDAVLLLLTPAAVVSANVAWEYQTTLALGQRLIPLLVAPCTPPAEVATLHYHNLHDPAALGREALLRDLRELEAALASPPPASTYHIEKAENSAEGDYPLADNTGQGLARPPTQVLPPSGATYQGKDVQCSAIGHQPMVVNAPAGSSWPTLLQHFERTEQALATRLMQRLDAQQRAATAALLAEMAAQQEQQQAELLAQLTRVAARLRVISQAPALQQRDPALARLTAEAADAIGEPTLTPRHRLKLTIPLVPLLAAYEGELELEQPLGLERLWQSWRGRWREE